MASLKGRQRSFDKFQLRTFRMEERDAPSRQKRRHDAERRRLRDRVGVPKRTDALTAQRRDFLFEILLLPEIQRTRSFGIKWNPNCSWASGPCIVPFAHIFDSFVGAVWSIRIVADIDGQGTPGWLFERS